MKKCLSPDDVMELSETQKNSLCGLWQPSKCDVAVEVVWKDVENDLCDAYVIIVTDVGLRTTHNQHYDVVLKVFYLGKPPQYENLDTETESEENDDDDDSYDDTMETEDVNLATDIEEKDQATPNETDHLLSKENCLPLLNIGQMIEIIGKHRSEQHISIIPGESICYIDGKEFSEEELCDALWEAVKTLL